MADAEILTRWAPRSEAALVRFLPPVEEPARTLREAMRYACLDGGKRLRATLVYTTGEMLKTPLEWLDYPAAAIEMIHAYSLVHDDLPAMDDDEIRRGKPTCHKVFGEAGAILAGDALQCRAFEVLSLADSPFGAAEQVAMIRTLSEASGVHGMVAGQSLDLAAVGERLDVEQLTTMHRLKTGALIRAAVRLGAQCGGQSDHQTLEQLDIYARSLGLCFQIVDDILDEVVDTATLGKTSGSDRARDKATYTTMLGIDEARAMVGQLHRTALESLATIRHNTEAMARIADFVVNRSF
jgi:farnesyl diphosphate synthase